jgi:hypothetical protein
MGLPALQDDYLFVLPLIAKRLADQVPDIPVEVVETADQVFAADQRARVLMVMWAGEGIGQAGRTTQQRYLVLLGLRNVATAKDARQAGAGPLMSQVHRALVNWVPPGAVNKMRRATAAMRPDIRKDKALYPLGFELELSL